MAQATFSCPFGAIHLEDRRGTPQRRTPFTNDGLPPDPITRVTPLAEWSISGAQNLSGALQFPPGPQGPWFCGKFQMVRFHIRAWLCRTNAPGPFPAVGAGPRSARRTPLHNLSPTATKALSNRRVPSSQLLPSERQRKSRRSVSTEPPPPLR